MGVSGVKIGLYLDFGRLIHIDGRFFGSSVCCLNAEHTPPYTRGDYHPGVMVANVLGRGGAENRVYTVFCCPLCSELELQTSRRLYLLGYCSARVKFCNICFLKGKKYSPLLCSHSVYSFGQPFELDRSCYHRHVLSADVYPFSRFGDFSLNISVLYSNWYKFNRLYYCFRFRCGYGMFELHLFEDEIESSFRRRYNFFIDQDLVVEIGDDYRDGGFNFCMLCYGSVGGLYGIRCFKLDDDRYRSFIRVMHSVYRDIGVVLCGGCLDRVMTMDLGGYVDEFERLQSLQR